MRVAVIDLGTFSAILLIAEVKRGRLIPLHEERRTVDLEYGPGRTISPTAIQRASDVLRRFNRRVRVFEIDRGIAVATAAMRHAGNRDAAVRQIRSADDLSLKVLSARQEAMYSAKGAMIGLAGPVPSSLIIDIGGGSTELIQLRSGAFRGLAIGAAWATKAWGKNAPRDRVKRDLHYLALSERAVLGLDVRRFGRLGDAVGLGGTITTLAAIKKRMKSFDVSEIHGSSLSREWIDSMATEMAGMTKKMLQGIVPFDPSRARVLLAGTYLWSAVLNRLNADRVTVSARGLRWGVAAHLAGLP